jgi:hypothetical protein
MSGLRDVKRRGISGFKGTANVFFLFENTGENIYSLSIWTVTNHGRICYDIK